MGVDFAVLWGIVAGLPEFHSDPLGRINRRHSGSHLLPFMAMGICRRPAGAALYVAVNRASAASSSRG